MPAGDARRGREVAGKTASFSPSMLVFEVAFANKLLNREVHRLSLHKESCALFPVPAVLALALVVSQQSSRRLPMPQPRKRTGWRLKALISALFS